MLPLEQAVQGRPRARRQRRFRCGPEAMNADGPRRPDHVVVVSRSVPLAVGYPRHDDPHVELGRTIGRRFEMPAQVEDVLLLAAERREVVLSASGSAGGVDAASGSVEATRWKAVGPEPTGKCPNCGELLYDAAQVCTDKCARELTEHLENT